MERNKSCFCFSTRRWLFVLVAVGVLLSRVEAKTFRVLHTFSGFDGAYPIGGLVFDKVGNLYGTTQLGGAFGQGAVYQLSRNSDGTWEEIVLYSFAGGTDGSNLLAGLVLDSSGNLYGTTHDGGINSAVCPAGGGTVFKLMPSANGSWIKTVLYSFSGSADGCGLERSGVIFDTSGNLYGTTAFAGSGGFGVVFKLTPGADGTWSQSVLHSFTDFNAGADGGDPASGVIFDAAGNLYGTTQLGGAYGHGTIFKLARKLDGSWSESILHSFCSGCSDGFQPSELTIDSIGNFYGVTILGGGSGPASAWPSGSRKMLTEVGRIGKSIRS